MKYKTLLHSEGSFGPSQSSTKLSGSEVKLIKESFVSLRQSDGQRLGFQFGSQTLAVIYMANTMVIPEMNQLQTEINFDSTLLLCVTILQYIFIMMCICLPSYMMIKQCEKHNTPFYNQVLNDVHPVLGRSFLLANITINILAMFNLVLRMIDFTLSSAPCMSRPTQEIVQSPDDSRFFFVWTIYCLSSLSLHFIISKISKFENFHQLQIRLVLTFVSKWLLFFVIFIILFNQIDCDKVNEDKSLIRDFSPVALLYYYFNILYCLSFPFIEIFYVKRETHNVKESGFHTVKQVYKTQLILRCTFFFIQIMGWGFISKIQSQNFVNCTQKLSVQLIMMSLTFMTIITAAPIYANNFSLNMQVLHGELMDSSETTHKKLIEEAYSISGLIMVVLYIVIILVRLVSKDFWIIRQGIIEMTQAIQGSCFGYACMALPLYVQSIKTKSFVQKSFFQVSFVISFAAFVGILAAPILRTIDKINNPDAS